MFNYKQYLELEVYKNNHNVFKKLYYKYFCVQTNAVYMIRKFQMLEKKKNIIFRLLSGYYKYRLVTKYNIFIGRGTEIGLGLNLPHPTSIILGEGVKLGDNCIIYQEVTIGGKSRGDYQKNNYPTIEDNCIFFAGCKILGKILIRNNTIVGANSVIISDTDSDSTYVGIPGRKL